MSLADVLRHAGPDACALIIGTGLFNGAGIPDSRIGRIMVFEPHPDRLALLQLQQVDRPNLAVVPASIGAENGPLRMRHFNYPAFDGFADPKVLRTVFPGLVTTRSTPVEQSVVTTLPDRLPKAKGNRDVLIIDRLGGEWDILQGLAKLGTTLRFSEVIVRTTRSGLLADGQGAQALIEWMRIRDFDRWLEIGESDPEFPVLHFSRNFVRKEVRALEKQVEVLDEVKLDRARALDDLAELQARYADKADENAALQSVLSDILQTVPQQDGAGASGKTAAKRSAKSKPPTGKKGK